MPIRFKVTDGMYLMPLNSAELSGIEHGFSSRCVMCREPLTSENKTQEHIYPKWLQDRYELWNKLLTLPNGSKSPYRRITVPCCQDCNGGKMAEWERKIQQASELGYDSFIQLDEEIIVWWILKLYYSKLILELSFKSNIRNPNSPMMFTEEDICNYNGIFYYMSELIRGVKFAHPKPYELYIYRTFSDHVFDYIDDISRHVVYIRLNDILIISSLDSFEFPKIQYEDELKVLNQKKKYILFKLLSYSLKLFTINLIIDLIQNTTVLLTKLE